MKNMTFLRRSQQASEITRTSDKFCSIKRASLLATPSISIPEEKREETNKPCGQKSRNPLAGEESAVRDRDGTAGTANWTQSALTLEVRKTDTVAKYRDRGFSQKVAGTTPMVRSIDEGLIIRSPFLPLPLSPDKYIADFITLCTCDQVRAGNPRK